VAGEKQFGFLTRNATAQSIDTKNSIAEAARAATAMENVARGIAESARAAQESVATLRERTATQMRPYLTVLIGNGVYQEREKDLRFEVRPILVNSGHTPAHNVTYRASAGVFNSPLPDTVVLADPDDTLKSAFVLGPQQNIILNAISRHTQRDLAQKSRLRSDIAKRKLTELLSLADDEEFVRMGLGCTDHQGILSFELPALGNREFFLNKPHGIGCFGVLINSHDDCLNVLVTPAFARS
jgi:hypothetical protein